VTHPILAAALTLHARATCGIERMAAAYIRRQLPLSAVSCSTASDEKGGGRRPGSGTPLGSPGSTRTQTITTSY
jgi:hypothetical protein